MYYTYNAYADAVISLKNIRLMICVFVHIIISKIL